MYGFTGINIDRFLNQEMILLSVSANTLVFHFENKLYINVEGKWALFDNHNMKIDEGLAEKHNEIIKVHMLIGKKVERYEVKTPEELIIHFNNNYSLHLYDDERYETCSISPDIII